MNNSPVESAKKGEEVCIKIENTTGAPRLIGRHFEATDELVTRISRKISRFFWFLVRTSECKTRWPQTVHPPPLRMSRTDKREGIDALKEWFRDEMTKEDWNLCVKLKRTFQIL